MADKLCVIEYRAKSNEVFFHNSHILQEIYKI